MEPNGSDTEKFSKPSWGGGVELIVVPPRIGNFFAGVLGFEGVGMLSQTTEFRDKITGLRVEQQTSQDYLRFYLGGRVGHQGHGFLRPYAGANIALVVYSISTDVVIPDDSDRENEIRQELESETKTTAGFDFALGLELNFRDKFLIDLGAKYLKSFSLPQQLGDGSVTIHPQYFAIFAGVAFAFDFSSGM
jgi:opacity protein-like surface antigen